MVTWCTCLKKLTRKLWAVKRNRSEIWNSGILAEHMWVIFDMLVFKVIWVIWCKSFKMAHNSKTAGYRAKSQRCRFYATLKCHLKTLNTKFKVTFHLMKRYLMCIHTRYGQNNHNQYQVLRWHSSYIVCIPF